MAAVLAAIGGLVASNARSTRILADRLILVATARTLLADLGRPEPRGAVRTGTTAGIGWRIDIVPRWSGSSEPAAPPRWIGCEITVRLLSPAGGKMELRTVRLARAVP